MRKETDEFSFVLKPSNIQGAGIGVFATHDIAKDTYLRLFGHIELGDENISMRKRSDLPQSFINLCIDMGDYLICPKDFGQMPVGWYMNHSSEYFNTIRKGLDWYAAQDIKVGEEILVDYNTLGEPKEYKDDYYVS